MRKRMLSMLLAMCLMVALTACGGTSSTDSNKSSSAATSQTSSSGIVSLSPTSTPEPTPEPTATPEPTPEPVSIAETVAYEDESLQILLQDFTLDSENNMGVTFYVENGSTDTNCQVEPIAVFVNGMEFSYYPEEGNWVYSVTAEAGGNASAYFNILDNSERTLQAVIGIPTDIEFWFSFEYTERIHIKGNQEFVKTHIYPYGEENAQSFVYESQPEDVILLETEDFVIRAINNEEFEKYQFALPA